MIVARLEQEGIRALKPAVGFPMEMEREKSWIISYKPVAVAAGLGKMGLHRNVIHPRFGNFILLLTIALDAQVTAYDQPLDYNPCLECKLCVAACPVGAIGSDGHFNFSACYTHNYRRRRRFGTILVDMQSHQVIDLLPDRKKETAATWMSMHPEVKLVSRDRGGDYAAVQ